MSIPISGKNNPNIYKNIPFRQKSPNNGNILYYPLEYGNKKYKQWIIFNQIEFGLNKENQQIIKNRSKSTIGLYLPGGIAFDDSMKYSNGELDIVGDITRKSVEEGAFGGGSGTGALRAKIFKKNITDPFSSTLVAGSDFFSGGELSPGIVTKMLQRFNKDNTKVGLGIRTALKRTSNPHIRALFNNVTLRSFNFSFDLVAESPQEAKVIEKIIQTFRIITYPEFDTSSSGLNAASELVYKFPDMVSVSLVRMDEQNNKFIQIGRKIQNSYITSVKTTYDPENTQGWRSDGKPVSIKLEIGISEDKTLSRKDIKKGF